ncbi:unnamed protein product, partial [Ceratitis capitata]
SISISATIVHDRVISHAVHLPQRLHRRGKLHFAAQTVQVGVTNRLKSLTAAIAQPHSHQQPSNHFRGLKTSNVEAGNYSLVYGCSRGIAHLEKKCNGIHSCCTTIITLKYI